MEQITFRTPNDQTFTVFADDEKADETHENVEGLVEASVQAQTSTLEDEKQKAESEAEALREFVVGEIVRHKKLAGSIDGEDEVNRERSYLEGLPAERLQEEYERSVENGSADKTVEMGEGGEGSEDEDKYAELGL